MSLVPARARARRGWTDLNGHAFFSLSCGRWCDECIRASGGHERGNGFELKREDKTTLQVPYTSEHTTATY